VTFLMIKDAVSVAGGGRRNGRRDGGTMARVMIFDAVIYCCRNCQESRECSCMKCFEMECRHCWHPARVKLAESMIIGGICRCPECKARRNGV